MIRTPLRQQIDLSRSWTFRRGRVDRKWLLGKDAGDETSVCLPHCWNETDTFQYGRHSYCGDGAYRRTFSVPPSQAPDGGGCWRLRSEGFYGRGEVWLDGRRLARVDGQYIGFVLDLPALDAGDHWLAIRLDNRVRKSQLPGSMSPDFLLYGGLTGRMVLEWTPAFHLDASSLEVVAGPEGPEGVAVRIRARTVNRSPTPRSAEVRWTIVDGEGKSIATMPPMRLEAVPAASCCPVESTLMAEDLRRWSPDDPRLYWAEGRLADGVSSDLVRLRFGFREAEFRPRQGFYLNGQRLGLHGCNRHESIPGVGAALPPELQRRDAESLKHLGCNFVRLSHYPQHPAFLDACDELGLMAYPEIATWKSVRSSARWRRAARRQMRALVLRDRHRPCVILWGMGNESRSRKAYTELREIIRELDPDRPTIYAENHLHRARRGRTVGLPDVWGTNYELDVLAEAALSSRLENVVVSECCNHPHSVKGEDNEELTQLRVLEQEWDQMANRPYVAGYAVWCFSDYATEHRNRFRRLAGLCDAWRRPKMAAELFRARHSSKAFVSLHVTAAAGEEPPSSFRQRIQPAGGRTADRDLHIFTNCDSVRVDHDGVSMGPFGGAIHYVVGLTGECDEIRVSGTHCSGEVEHVWRQPGPASRFEISADPAAPGSGLTFPVDLAVVDDNGLQVDTWNGPVRLALEGPARLRVYTHEGESVIARGEGRIYITCGQAEAGAISVTADAEGLQRGSADFTW